MKKLTLKQENKLLRSIITDIAWMARRYATGRSTYAPPMYNEAISIALGLGLKFREDGIETPPTIWAKDGMYGWPKEYNQCPKQP